MSEEATMKQKIAILALGILIGGSIYGISKKMQKHSTNKELKKNKKATVNHNQEIEREIRSSLKQYNEEFLEKQNQALKDLITERHCMQDELVENSEMRFAKVKHIADMFPDIQPLLSPMSLEVMKQQGQNRYFTPDKSFVSNETVVLQEKYYFDTLELQSSLKFMRAGARKQVYFKGNEVKAAIVTCGGLCPGLNVVIRQLVMTLYRDYGVSEVYGIKWGYRGFYQDFPNNWRKLTPQIVDTIHNLGGTMLGTTRGCFNAQEMQKSIKKMGINQLYIIGGDGTHRGILELQKELRKEGVQVSIAGIPKTIDNDIPLIDRSFGFETAVQEAVQFIEAANVEAEAAEYGIGIVKLMGRYCGYISVAASLASRDVNICLIPEVHFQLYGNDGVYEAIIERAKIKGHCIIVIAEGAEDGLIPEERQKIREELGIHENIKDESGNIKNVDIPAFIKSDLGKYAQANHNIKLTIKYLDPMYAIRTTKSNNEDTILCTKLATCAVHGLMAGFTDFSVGLVRDENVMIPIDMLVEAGSRKMKRKDYDWQRLLSSTGQWNFLSPENYGKTIKQEQEVDIKRKERLLAVKSKALQFTKKDHERRGGDLEDGQIE